MKRLHWILCAATLASAVTVTAPVARADHDVSFGARAPIGDDLFFSISGRYFDRDRYVVSDWARRFRNPDDLAVFFYIVNRTGRSPEQIYAIRMRGTPWFEVGRQSGMHFRDWY